MHILKTRSQLSVCLALDIARERNFTGKKVPFFHLCYQGIRFFFFCQVADLKNDGSIHVSESDHFVSPDDTVLSVLSRSLDFQFVGTSNCPLGRLNFCIWKFVYLETLS